MIDSGLINKGTYLRFFLKNVINAVFRIRMDPELLPGSGIIDPDPAKSERADTYNCEFWTRI